MELSVVVVDDALDETLEAELEDDDGSLNDDEEELNDDEVSTAPRSEPSLSWFFGAGAEGK